MTFQINSTKFKTLEAAENYRKRWAKMHLNSHYGALGTIHYNPVSTGLHLLLARRDDMEKASIWVRLFGERPKKVKPLPGGETLQFESSTVIRMGKKDMAASVTKTGQKSLRKIQRKMAFHAFMRRFF